MKRCIDCNRHNREYRKIHPPKHTGQFKCTHEGCDVVFIRKGDLKRHVNAVHLKLQPHKCSTCDYNCSSNDLLQRHISSVHLKLRPFKCTSCDSAFANNSNLQTHIKAVHQNLRLFKCTICECKFARKGDLQQHVNAVHLKLKPYACSTCDYKFAAKSDLNAHIPKCTGEIKCSAGEFQIMKTLDKMRIEYEFNSSFEVKSDKSLLRWDFIIKGFDEPIFLEMDGIQHFEPVRFGGMSEEKAQAKFERQKKYDKIKNDYCDEKNYLLLRIPYKEFGNIHQIVSKFMIENTSWDSDIRS